MGTKSCEEAVGLTDRLSSSELSFRSSFGTMAGMSLGVGLSGSRRLEVVASFSSSSSSSNGLFLWREPLNRSLLWSWESTWLSSILDLEEEGGATGSNAESYFYDFVFVLKSVS